MFSARCGLETLSFCACQHSGYLSPGGSRYRRLHGRGLSWACVRTLVPQGSRASTWGKGCSRRGHSATAWTPVASPLLPPVSLPSRPSVLHGPCPDGLSRGGTQSRRGRWLLLSVDSLGRQSLSSSTCPDLGEFSGCPPTRPSQLYLVEPGLQGRLLPSPETFSAGMAGDSLAGPIGAEGTERHSRLRDEPPWARERVACSAHGFTDSCDLVQSLKVVDVGFVLMLDGSCCFWSSFFTLSRLTRAFRSEAARLPPLLRGGLPRSWEACSFHGVHVHPRHHLYS